MGWGAVAFRRTALGRKNHNYRRIVPRGKGPAHNRDARTHARTHVR